MTTPRFPGTRRAHRTRARALLVVGVAAALGLTGVAAPLAASAASSGHHHHGSASSSKKAAKDIRYAVNRPLCTQPSTPDGYTCFALRRVTVAKDTPGARAYVVPDVAHGPAGGLTPGDLAKAYGYNPNISRRYQTVGIVDWYDDPHAAADLNRFDAHYGLPKETPRSFRKVNQAGRTSHLPKADRSSSGEIALDIEAVRAVCHTCRILLVEANTPTDRDLATAVDTAARLGATEISNSYGAMEHSVSSSMRKAFDHPGVVITASTGDSGWYGWDDVNGGRYRSPGRASYPSTDPHVVAVGGTTLSLASNGARASETVWNGNGTDDSAGLNRGRPLGASGGGCSHYFTGTSWQRGHAGYAATGCRGKRLASDVAADADPRSGLDVINTFQRSGYPSWLTVGGTSLSSPVVAAMYALAGGAANSAYPSASLYLNATHHASTLYDVTAGGNSFCGGDTTSGCASFVSAHTRPKTNNPNATGLGTVDCSFTRANHSVSTLPRRRSECNAVTGFDGPSGLGTPRNLGLFAPTNPRVSISRPSRVHPKHHARFSAKAVERIAGLHPVRFAWNFGDGHSSSGSHAAVSHSYARKGHYRVVLRVTDSSGQSTVVHTYIRVG